MCSEGANVLMLLAMSDRGATDSAHAARVRDTVESATAPARSAIAASWHRSALRYGLDPEDGAERQRLEQSGINALHDRDAALLEIAKPVLDQMFVSVGRSGCGVFLSNVDGVLLARRVGDGDATSFANVGLVEGTTWSEAAEGTNGIGTCLVEDMAVTVHRDEHFATRNIGISCTDAPVHDPHGRLAAALDVSSCRDDHGPAMAEMVLALVRDAARRIERNLFCQHFAGNRIVFLADDTVSGTALLAVDRDDLVVGVSRAARMRLDLKDEALALPRTLDQLLGGSSAPSFDDGDRATLRQAMAQAQGNASKAARLLGIGRATLYRRMARVGLTH